jgi:hypothetical protein
VVLYLLIAIIYLLGLRMWYLPALPYSVINMVMFFVSGAVAIPGVTTSALTGHLAFGHYSFGRGFSVGARVYLMVVGSLMIRLDRGSRLNDLLRDSWASFSPALARWRGAQGARYPTDHRSHHKSVPLLTWGVSVERSPYGAPAARRRRAER